MPQTPDPSAGTCEGIAEPWRVPDIVLLSIMGPLLLAAFLEWFLWLAAFMYCLIKAFRKAEHCSSKVLAVILLFIFTSLRGIFLPVMIVTIPLPQRLSCRFPRHMTDILQWFGFWTFSVLLFIPYAFCLWRVGTTHLGRNTRVKIELDEDSAPKTVVVMPVYKENPAALLAAINSVVDCDYPVTCVHLFLSFDGDDVDELYLNTAERIGFPVNRMREFPISMDILYNGARVTLSRFPHGGKRHCQKMTFKLIDKIYADYIIESDNLFILFIDSDCVLHRNCLQNFMLEMELTPSRKHPMLAMTGVITPTTDSISFLTLLQDMEYVHGQLFERSVEAACGSVTCLPGALTLLRFSAFKNMSKFYFADKTEGCEDLFDYSKCHLGEDRWLTHLFMIGAQQRYQIGMCTSAFCKTEAVQTFRSLMKQRRRWFLGFITNEVCMMTDLRLWRRYPLLSLIRFGNNTIRTTSLLFFMMVLSVATTSTTPDKLPIGFILVSLGLNYTLMLYFGWKLKRFKAWLYPVMFIVNPFFNWCYMVYGVCSAGQRTWGGPRADAAVADLDTSPVAAVERATEMGDELNVAPETFAPAAAKRRVFAGKPARRARRTRLQPSRAVEGAFNPEDCSCSPRRTSVSASSGRPIGPGMKASTPTDSDWSDSDNEAERAFIQTPRRIGSLVEGSPQEDLLNRVEVMSGAERRTTRITIGGSGQTETGSDTGSGPTRITIGSGPGSREHKPSPLRGSELV